MLSLPEKAGASLEPVKGCPTLDAGRPEVKRPHRWDWSHVRPAPRRGRSRTQNMRAAADCGCRRAQISRCYLFPFVVRSLRGLLPGVVGTVPAFPLPGVTPLGGVAFPGVGADSRSVAVVERCWLPGAEIAVPRPAPTAWSAPAPPAFPTAPWPAPLLPAAAPPPLPPPLPPPPP